MAVGITDDLLLIALSVGLLGFWICSRTLPFLAALVVTFVKVAVPTTYFAFFFDGSWTILDDQTYFRGGRELLHSDYTPITVFTTPEGFAQLIETAGTNQHFLYHWWSFLAQSLFGEHYYAPVFLNVLLTFVGGYFLTKLVRLCGFSEGYARGLLVFFLLHWEVLAWSSFVNLKDVLVMTLTLTCFYFILRLSKKVSLGSLLAVGLILLVLTTTRVYVPLGIVAATSVWGIMRVPGRRRYLLLLGAVLGGLGVLGVVRPGYIWDGLNRLNPASSISDVVRFSLTPLPWSISSEYSFLLLPSIFHWLLFVPALCGGWLLWRRSREAALLLIYLVMIVMLYGLAEPEYQGPRQRFQVSFVVAWMQFHFLWVALWAAVSSAVPASRVEAVGSAEAR